MAAQTPATDAVSAYKPCLVSDADLTQFYPGFEVARQIPDEFSEIHASVSREVEQDLGIVPGILRGNELHLQTALPDLIPAGHESVLFSFSVGGLLFQIDTVCRAHYLPERLHHITVFNIVGRDNYCAEFLAS